MPPPAAIKGTFKGPDGKAIKVPPLSDEARRTIVRWIDLGCPINLDSQYGWFLDDDRPVLTLASPAPGHAGPVTFLRVGLEDYGSGLDMKSFKVTASVDVNGKEAGENLAPLFMRGAKGVWELPLQRPLPRAEAVRLEVSVSDRQGNLKRIVRVTGPWPERTASK